MSYVNFDNEPLMFNDDFIIRESTLTLLTNGNGTLTADKLTGMPGDTVVLVPTNSSYYRLISYSVTGGTIENNIFTFGYTDATAQANFGINYFTATGIFPYHKIVCQTTGSWAGNGFEAYPKLENYTGSIPSSWNTTGYENLEWLPRGASAYSMTMSPIVSAVANISAKRSGFSPGSQNYGATASASGSIKIRSNYYLTQNFNLTGCDHTTAATWEYKKTLTTTEIPTGVETAPWSLYVRYGVSANNYIGTNYYWSANISGISADNLGTWTATGIAP